MNVSSCALILVQTVIVFQETAQLEADIFVQRQKVALASEVKAVLDSWVRFEQQEKESEQAELAKTVIDNVLKSVRDEKVQKEILVGAVAEIERKCTVLPVLECASSRTNFVILLLLSRTCQEQGYLDLMFVIVVA